MSSRPPLALSIVIATPGRVASLRQVLAGLAACRVPESWEVLVVDNASEPPMSAEALATPGIPALRLVRELQRGKSYALNCALEAGALGEIVAVIDDDMTVPPDWIAGVLAATRRLPQFDIFAGRSQIIWPDGVRKPGWADEPLARGMLFSVIDVSANGDREFGVDCPRFPSGNLFWFRRSIVDTGARFPHVWTTEARFVIRMLDAGKRGMFVPEVSIGHRIQPELVDPQKFYERARKFGREMAEVDVTLGGRKGLVASLRAALRPARAFLGLCGWAAAWCLALLRPERKRVPALARAIWGIHYCRTRMSPSPRGSAA